MIGFDLLTASLGLAASALAAALLLSLWRRAPVPAYRLAVSVLAAALALPLLQAGARALDLPVPHPVRDLAQRLARPVPAALSPSTAEPLELWLTPEEARELVLDEALLASLDTSELPARPRPAPAPLPAARRVPWPGVLVALWAAGALWSLARTLLRLRATRRLFAEADPVAEPAVLAVWETVRGGSRLGARTRLLQSSRVRTPACSGLVHPAVVLPAGAGLERRPDLLACVLTHELVHLERRDPWVLVGEELLRAAFWFHPAAWWLVARLAALRELSCDCLVVRRTGSAKRYASALVEYASWMQRPAARTTWAAVVPWSGSRGHLTRRIEMLLQPRDTARTGRVLAPAAVGVLMTFLWSGQLALATSSCAGTRAETAHDHPHEHADAHEVHAVHDDGSHEVRGVVVGPEGQDGKRVVWHVDDDDQDAVRVESHVVVIQEDGAARKVLTGEDAKRWLAENDPGAKVHHLERSKTKQAWIEEIQRAMRDSDGDPEVFVLGSDGTKAKSKSKSWSWTSADSEGEFEVIVTGPLGERADVVRKGGKARAHRIETEQGEDGEKRVRVLLHDGEGEGHWLELEGGGRVLKLDGKFFDLDFGKGAKGELHFGGAEGAFFGKAHAKQLHDQLLELHGSDAKGAQGLPKLDRLFEVKPADSELEHLRRELEETRAALEKQRRMLEELRLQLEKQRSKVNEAAHFVR